MSEHGRSKLFNRLQDFDPIYQLHFLNRVPLPEFMFKTLGKPTRTFLEATTEDCLDTITLIRQTYIPNCSEDERDSLPVAILWLQENTSKYNDNDSLVLKDNNLPPFVLMNFRTIFFIKQSVVSKSSENSALVAYQPETEDWVNDVLKTTFHLFEKIKTHPRENRKFDNRIDSTTNILDLVLRFFWSGGEHKRSLAIDFLTQLLYNKYWVTLGVRSQQQKFEHDLCR